MDFIVGLPRTQKGNNMIWVIVDRLTKSTHFIPMKDTWNKAELSKAYVKNVVKLHDVPKDIIFYRELSIGMTPFEALYGRKCRSPVYWDNRTDAVVLGPEMIQEMVEQVHIIRQKMRAAQDRQKSYADLKRSDIEFSVGDKVLLKVVGEVAYRLTLPPALDRVHNVLHVSQLRKYVSDPTYVLEHEHIEIDERVSYVEEPKEILEIKVRKTRNGETALVKVLWSNYKVEEATWEAEAAMRDQYPSFMVSTVLCVGDMGWLLTG
ncbi:uncharacterized protein LOC141588605 [Silene latifolia]|uniref:uncharacterized protein LOC141588605 n=1 Tax=Silene latifolia TaxID=37657 RepID=UPI003D777EF6